MRQYQAFRQMLVLPSPALAGLGDSAPLAFPAPAYDKAAFASDAKQGTNSLPYVQSSLMAKMLRRQGKPAYGMIPLPSLPSSSQVPVDVVVAAPPPPPVPVLVGTPGAAGGGDVPPGGPGSPPGTPGTPWSPDGGGGVVWGAPGLSPNNPTLLAQGFGGNAVAYGGQSIVNIALPSNPFDVQGYATPGYSSAGEAAAAAQDADSLLPEDNDSWIKFAAGFALGWLALKWARRGA